jgi:hypothetical protein
LPGAGVAESSAAKEDAKKTLSRKLRVRVRVDRDNGPMFLSDGATLWRLSHSAVSHHSEVTAGVRIQNTPAARIDNPKLSV